MANSLEQLQGCLPWFLKLQRLTKQQQGNFFMEYTLENRALYIYKHWRCHNTIVGLEGFMTCYFMLKIVYIKMDCNVQ